MKKGVIVVVLLALLLMPVVSAGLFDWLKDIFGGGEDDSNLRGEFASLSGDSGATCTEGTSDSKEIGEGFSDIVNGLSIGVGIVRESDLELSAIVITDADSLELTSLNPSQKVIIEGKIYGVELVAASDTAATIKVSVKVSGIDSIDQLAYDLDQEYNFGVSGDPKVNDYYFNYRDLKERYLFNGVDWFYILPNSDLYFWGGSIDDSTYLATLDSSYNADPSKLIDVVNPLFNVGSIDQRAYELDNHYDFAAPNDPDSDYYFNYRDLKERYLYNGVNWFYILPGGEFYLWGGTIADSTYLATLDGSYNLDPSLLIDVPNPSSTKEVLEGTSKEVNGISIFVNNADETNLALSAKIIVGSQVLSLSNNDPSILVTVSSQAYTIELVSASNTAATVKVGCGVDGGTVVTCIDCKWSDRNNDGKIDFGDFVFFSACYRSSVADKPECAWADRDGNGIIGEPDLDSFEVCFDKDKINENAICLNSCVDGACVEIDVTCTDSDGGKSYYEKGEVRGLNEAEVLNEEDYCTDSYGLLHSESQYLREYSCGSSSSYIYEDYECPNGCQDGACVGGTSRIRVITDDSASVTDLSRSVDIKFAIENEYNAQVSLFKNSEISQDDLVDKISIFFYNGKAIVIWWKDTSVEDLALAINIQQFMINEMDIETEIIKNSEVLSNDLKDTWDLFFGSSPTCADSDGGRNYFDKGNIRFYSDGIIIEQTDQCGWYADNIVEPNILTEWYCESDIEGEATRYTCPNGCQDGVCVRNEVIVDNIEECLDDPDNYWDEKTNKCYSGFSDELVKLLCSDPDGGEDIYKQTHTFGFRETSTSDDPSRDLRIRTEELDSCTFGSLEEFYCDENGYIKFRTFDCPSGSCLNGVCIKERLCVDGTSESKSMNEDVNPIEVINGLSVAIGFVVENNDNQFSAPLILDASRVRLTNINPSQDVYINGEIFTIELVSVINQNSADIQVTDSSGNIESGELNEGEDLIIINGVKFFHPFIITEEEGVAEIIEEGILFFAEMIIGNKEIILNSEFSSQETINNDLFTIELDVVSNTVAMIKVTCGVIECIPQFSCETSPLVCPPHGTQTYKCEDTECGLSETIETILCTPGECSGCLLEDNCVPYGFRVEIDEDNVYCEITGEFEKQKTKDVQGNWATCQNSYECESNLCSSGECIEIGEVIKKAGTFRTIFVKVICKLGNLFDLQDYNQCVLENLGEEVEGSNAVPPGIPDA